MSCRVSAALLPVVVLGLACAMPARGQETVDLEKAKADPDFAIQGEYQGQSEDGKEKFGVQVIARGDGKFDAVFYPGGLPGDGWKLGDKKSSLQAKRTGETAEVSGFGFSGKISGQEMTLVDGKKQKLSLKRIDRKSPTLGRKPPAGSTVLFDGTTADKFQNGKLTKDKYLDSEATSKQKFEDYHLHLEFRLSYMPKATGQGRSNSGVYLHDCYEIQVLDSFGLEGLDNECGGFYQTKRPAVNMCLPPMAWQTYDIDFIAPKYEGGKKVANARVTLRHNGVLIHDNIELPHDTPGRQKEGPSPRPLYLQGHGNHVYFRNIWLTDKAP
jgi:hypothetical protein